jgi:hypothetical protein
VTQAADDYTLSLSASSVSASASKPGTLMLTMTPTGGVAAAQSFACTGLPSGWSCSFAAATLSGSTPQSTTITVSAMSAAQMSALRSGMQMAVVWPLPLLLIGAPSMRRGRERIDVKRWILGAMALTALVLAGCGGSGSGAGGDGDAQPVGGAQTYAVTVTATGTNAVTHSTQFTLTVTS